jgi:hypothetical protein
LASGWRGALGLKPRTGWAAVIVIGGPVDAPELRAKTRIDVATTFEQGAVFHQGQALSLDEARALVHDAELRFVEHARAELLRLVADLGCTIAGAAVVGPVAKPLPPLESVLKSHALVHAAEGELYRRVFAEASAALGVTPTRLPRDALAASITAARGLTSAEIDARLALMGKASGKPWTVDQKEATLAGWVALSSEPGS